MSDLSQLLANSQINSENFINTRSFLIANVERILSSVSSRREARKIDVEDLFGDSDQSSSVQTNWIDDYEQLPKRDILMMEKEILGLYVSGNPLQDYIELQDWTREVTGYDDIYIVIVEKIKKIFTKAGAMMLGLQITIIPEEGKEAQIDGVVYSKKTPIISPILEEKQIFWVKGKLSEPKEKEKTENAKDEVKEENSEINSDIGIDTGSEQVFEQREYVENTKLIFDSCCILELGVLGVFGGEEYKLSNPRREILETVNWKIVASDPSTLGQTETDSKSELPDQNFETKHITITDKLSVTQVKNIKANLNQDRELDAKDFYKIELKIIHLSKSKIIDKAFWMSKSYYHQIQSLIQS
jgi:hypothetical protein